MGSVWSGNIENAYFSVEQFDRNRRITMPEKEYSLPKNKNQSSYYILSMDVARLQGCDSVITVFKVIPQADGTSIKQLVNIYVLPKKTDFTSQAILAKKLFFKYKARVLVIDGNGLGVALTDELVKEQNDNGEYLPPFGIINDEKNDYSQYITENTILGAVYIIKANGPLNTEIFANVRAQMAANKVRFLIDERTAKTKLLESKIGKKMSPEERADYLMPFTLTSSLKEEMANLKMENDGVNIILKRSNSIIPKDKFSAFCYGLYYIKLTEDTRKKKRNRNFSDMIFLN